MIREDFVYLIYLHMQNAGTVRITNIKAVNSSAKMKTANRKNETHTL